MISRFCAALGDKISLRPAIQAPENGVWLPCGLKLEASSYMNRCKGAVCGSTKQLSPLGVLGDNEQASGRACRLWLLEKDEFWSTIFSSSSMSSACRLAAMNAFTATDTCSGFLLSGSAVDTTCTTAL